MTATPFSNLAKRSVGAGNPDHLPPIDMVRMRAYRLGRLQAQIRRLDYAGAVLFDPINVRYATGSRNMTVWMLHNAARYCFVPAEGKAVLFDFHNCEHLSKGLETIGEVRPARGFFFYSAGNRMKERADAWAKDLDDAIRKHIGREKRIAFDHLDPLGCKALERFGYEIHDAQEPCELARAIKSPEEIACAGHAIAVCEAGMARMRDELRPGLTEDAIWAILSETNIRMGGEFMECRLLSSGARTNPWFKESGERVIRPGDLVSFDTDLIGPFGMCVDLSRTFLCGPAKATDEQRKLYGLALEQIHYNMDILKPGMTFREFGEKAWRIPNAYVANRYSCVAHGVGLCDEWPKIPHAQDAPRSGYDGTLEPNMTICIESYIGEEGGPEGVKLEQQVLITETGCESMSSFPFEDALMS